MSLAMNLSFDMLGSNCGRSGNWKDMATISLKDCSATEAGQQWNVMADGRIALAASSPRKRLPRWSGMH